MPSPSLALNNLRGFVIIIVLAFHSVLAYLRYGPPAPRPFNEPPYQWLSFPIVDGERWFGFDLFCAWQDVYLISLMFFLSGLFVWRSFLRKGPRAFVADRLLRLALPWALIITLLMPIAYYPSYAVAAADVGLGAYLQHWLALGFWPNGPPWFLGELLIFDIVVAAVFAVAPGAGEGLARLATDPKRFVVILGLASFIGYLPMALAFTPGAWTQLGPFGIQLSRPLHYAVYFGAGIAVGAHGIERGLLAADGLLVRHWGRAVAAAVVAYVVWLGSAGLAFASEGPAPLAIQTLVAACFVLACATGCLAALAAVVHFANRRLPAMEMLNENAYGMYLIHYVFVVWLQYTMMAAPLFAVFKGIAVFAGTLVLSVAATVGLRRIPAAARIIGSEGRAAQPTTR
jgi:acyltransferase-like protein